MEETQRELFTQKRDPEGFTELFNKTFTDIDLLCKTLLEELKRGTASTQEKYTGETIFVTVEQGGKQIYSQEETIFPNITEDSLRDFVSEVKNALSEKNSVGEGDYTLKITNQ